MYNTVNSQTYTVISIFTGECWSDVKAEQKYNKYGPTDKCFQNYNQTCPQGSDACAGGEEANFVYQIVTSKYWKSSLMLVFGTTLGTAVNITGDLVVFFVENSVRENLSAT